MIAASGVLTPVAVALLIAGLLTAKLPLLIAALVVSVAAGAFLAGAIRARRAEFGSAAASDPAPVGTPPPFPPMAPSTSPSLPLPPLPPEPWPSQPLPPAGHDGIDVP